MKLRSLFYADGDGLDRAAIDTELDKARPAGVLNSRGMRLTLHTCPTRSRVPAILMLHGCPCDCYACLQRPRCASCWAPCGWRWGR
jgi:hypothetical protein